MKRLITLAACAVAVSLSACATFDPAAFAKAANDLDPGCYKHVEIKATPMLLFGWAVPVVGGEYVKTCNPGQAAPASPAVAVGTLIPGV